MADELTLALARGIVRSCLAAGRRLSLMPLAVVVLDARATIKALEAEDGTAIGRVDLAIGKANAALQLGIGTRALAKRALAMPQFFAAVGQTIRGGFIPNAGGVLIRNGANDIIGAIGVSGDVGPADEGPAIAAIEEAGLIADPGIE